MSEVRFTRARGIPWRNVGDEVIVISSRDGQLERLSATAGAVWRRLDVPRSVPELAAGLAAIYDADPGSIASDVEGLLTTLCERELVSRA